MTVAHMLHVFFCLSNSPNISEHVAINYNKACFGALKMQKN